MLALLSGGEAAAATYREEGLNDVGLDGAERFVPDDDEDLLLFLQVNEVAEPGFLGEPAARDGEEEAGIKACLPSFRHCCSH